MFISVFLFSFFSFLFFSFFFFFLLLLLVLFLWGGVFLFFRGWVVGEYLLFYISFIGEKHSCSFHLAECFFFFRFPFLFFKLIYCPQDIIKSFIKCLLSIYRTLFDFLLGFQLFTYSGVKQFSKAAALVCLTFQLLSSNLRRKLVGIQNCWH